MATRIAINGFGRIGRLVFRALHAQGLFGSKFEVVAVGDIVPADNLAYLLKFDSVQGKFGQVVRVGAHRVVSHGLAFGAICAAHPPGCGTVNALRLLH